MKNSALELTVLTSRGVNAVKTFRRAKNSKKIETEGYGKAKSFTAETIRVDEKGKWLEKLRSRKHSFVVLGQPKNWKRGEIKRRLSVSRDGDDATLDDVPRALMPIDVDQIDFVPMLGIEDGESFAREILDRLGLHGVRCVWHLTNTHGFFGKYRARLWIELSIPMMASQMKQFAKDKWGDEKVEVEGKMKSIVDLAVYQCQQPIYTGDPILIGVDDPVEKRVGFIDGDSLKVKLKSQKEKRGAPEDDNIAKLQDEGLYIKRLKPGQHCIVCPWEDEHSGEEREDDTFYFEPFFNGHDIPAYKCHHASCEARGWNDVLEFMGDEQEDDRDPNWVYVHRLKSFWDARDGTLIDRESYDSSHGGRSRNGTPTERFIRGERGEKADAIEFLPGAERFVMRGRVRILNTYIDQRIDPEEDDVTPWLDHLEWVIPGKDDREHLMDWLAWCYQRPGEKITWAPILYGPPGTGKTTVFNCLARCLGLGHVSEPSQAELEDKFNDWCYGKLLVKIEELMSGDKFHVAEKLKPIVANPTVSVRRMHQTGFSVTNVANVCASTNHMQALPLEKGDRRYMLIQCVEATEQERRPRMRAFYKWLAKAGYAGIAGWLNDRDVDDFVPTAEAPGSALKDMIIEASKTDFERAIDLCDVFDRVDIISSAMVKEYLHENECPMNEKRIGLIAGRRKWYSLPDSARVRIGNRRIAFWTHPKGKLALQAFLAKKPAERERAHAALLAKAVFGDQSSRKDEIDDVDGSEII